MRFFPLNMNGYLQYSIGGLIYLFISTLAWGQCPSPPNVDIDPNDPLVQRAGDTILLCFGNTALNLINNDAQAEAPTFGLNVEWGDGSESSFPGTQASFSHTYPDQGFYNLKITSFNASNGSPCPNPNQINFIVYIGRLPTADLTALDALSVCAPTDIRFATSPLMKENSPGTIYRILVNGVEVFDFDQDDVNGGAVDEISVPFIQTSCGETAPGGDQNAFDVRIEARNPCGNTFKTLGPVLVSTVPDLDFSIEPPLLPCTDECWRFTNTSIINEIIPDPSGKNNVCLNQLPPTWSISPGVQGIDWELCSGNLIGDQTIEVRFLTPGDYEISMTITSINCGSTQTVTKTLPPIEEPPAAEANATVIGDNCVNRGADFELKDISEGDYQNRRWEIRRIAPGGGGIWEFIDGTTDRDSIARVRFNQWGTYEVSLDLNGQCGDDVWRDTVAIFDTPLLTLNALPDVCDATTLDIDETNYTVTPRGSAVTSYRWEFRPDGTPFSSSEAFPQAVDFNTPGTKTVFLEITNFCGLRNRTVDFEVIAEPLLSLPNDTAFCLNDPPFQFTATASDPNGTGLWSGNGISADGTFDPAAAGIGTTTLTYTYTLGPCMVSQSFSVEIRDLPQIEFDNPPSVVCQNIDSLTINLLTPPTPTGGDWSISNGGQITTEGTFLPNVSGPGLYTIFYQTPPDPISGCTNLDSFSIRVEPLPIVNVNDTLVCDAPELVNLVGLPTVGGIGIWSDDGSGRIVDANAGLFNAVGGTTGSPFKVFYSFTNFDGCTNMDSALVSIGPPPPINAGPNLNFCINDPPFDLNTQVGTPGGVWNGQGLVGSFFDPLLAGQGTFPLIYQIGTGNCASRDTISATVNTLPSIDFLSPDQICSSEDTLSLQARPGGGVWNSLDSGLIVSDSLFLPSLSGPGLYRFSYETGPDENGCQNIGSFFISVQPLPNVNAPDQTICDQRTILQPGSPQPGTWSGPGIIDPLNGEFDPDRAALITEGPPPYFVAYSHQDPFTGCVNVDTAQIDVIEIPQVDPGPNEFVCFTDSTYVLSGFSPAGGIWSGPGIIGSSGQFDPSVGAGNYVVTYTFSPSGVTNCSIAESKVVTVIDLTNTEAGPDQTACLLDAPINLTGSPAGGIFTGPGVTGSISIGFEFNPVEAGTGNQVILYTRTENRCSFSDSLSITVFPMPESNFESDSFACINIQQIQFTNTSSIQGLLATSSWDFGDGNTSSLNNPRHTYMEPGAFEVKLTMETLLGCTDSVTRPIQVEGPPIVDFERAPGEVCAEVEPVSFINLSTGFETRYEWNFGNGNFSDEFNPGPEIYTSGTSDTVYLISLFAENVCGNDLQRELIQVRPFPNTRFTIEPDSGCSPFNVGFINLSTPDDEETTYSWDFRNGNRSLDRNPSPERYETVASRDSVYPTLIVRNGCGVDTAQTLIKVDPPDVQPRFNVPNPDGCNPHTIVVTNQAFPPSANIFWDWGDGTTSTDPDPGSHTYTRPGSFLVTQTVSNSCGSASITESVQVNPTPSVSFSFADFPCALDPVLFINEAAGANSFIWEFGDGNTSFEPNPIHVYDSGGVYDVTLTAFDSITGCPNTFSTSINVRVAPEVAFTVDNFNGCTPVTAQFSNETQGNFFFRWDFGDGNSSVEKNPEHTYQIPGSYTVRLTAFDDFGCDDESTFSPVSVIPIPTADFSFDPDRQCELPVTLQFNNLSEGGEGYQWTFEEGAFDSDINPSYTYRTPGNKSIQLIATNSFQCRDTIEKPFLATPQPMADFSWDPGAGCQPLTVTFKQESSDATNYTWDFGDGRQAVGTEVVNTYFSPGTYTVTLIADYEGQCQDTLSLPDLIEVFASPIANFSFKQLDAPNGQPSGTFAFTNLSNGASSYMWDFGDGATSTETNPTHTYGQNGDQEVTLVAISQNDCRDTLQLLVSPDLIATLFIPNVFTPEGTGSDEVRLFKPKGIGLQSFRIEVFNRYGQRVWKSEKLLEGVPAEPWDGRLNGELVEQGNYSWKANATFQDGSAWKGMDDGKGGFKRQGSITIVR